MEVMSSQELLRQHLTDSVIETTIKNNTKKVKKKGKGKIKTYKCRRCKKEFETKTDLAVHILTHENELYECPICHRTFETAAKRKIHKNNVHRKREFKYKCDFCGKLFQMKDKWQQHEMVHTGEKPLKCEVCGKQFRVKHSLNSHMLIHSDSKPFVCAFCPYSCRDSSTLRKHQHAHLGIRAQYKCTKCDKTYTQKYLLKIHIAQDHLMLEDSKVECHICRKKYRHQSSLYNHIRITHELAYATRCPICNMHLANRNNLNAHISHVHNQEKNYICDHEGCEKRFKTKCDLQKHARIHKPELYLECATCGRQFIRKERLVKHMKTHEERKRTEKCEQCGKRFYNAKYLKSHKNRVHGTNLKKCDHCSFTTANKPALIGHLKRHDNDNDKTCKICLKTYKEFEYLKSHYLKTHNMRYKSRPIKRKPKMQPEVEKQENNEQNYFKDPEEKEVEFEVKVIKEEIDLEEEEVKHALDNALEIQVNIPLMESDSESCERDDKKCVSEIIASVEQHKPIGKIPEKVFDEFCSKKIESGEVNLKRWHKPPTINPEPTSRKQLELRRARRQAKKREIEVQREKERQELEVFRREYNERLLEIAENRRKVEKHPEPDIQKITLKRKADSNNAIENNNSLANPEQTDKQTESLKDNEKETSLEMITRVIEKNGGVSKKITFNMTQCYVCFKLFPTSEELIEHCKTHFDVCSEKILKKCPFCDFAGNTYFVKHVKINHKVVIKTQEGDSYFAENGKYFVNVNSAYDIKKRPKFKLDIKRIEIIPSIKSLNRREYIKLDRQRREMKLAQTINNKLVKKGKEWIVLNENIDIDYENYLLPVAKTDATPKGFKHEISYIDLMKKLKIIAKEEDRKILYPCERCDRVCRNIAALIAHVKKHEGKSKTGKRKKKVDISVKRAKKITKNIEIQQKDTKNSNNELREFFENNVQGTGVDFEQFSQIFKAIDRVGNENFNILERNENFGVTTDIDDLEQLFETPICKIQRGSVKSIKTKMAAKKIAFKSKIKKPVLSKKEITRRNAIKEQLREKIRMNSQ